MRGYIYICKMRHEGESYYKIGRALNVAKREAELKVGNPFFSVIAIKQTARSDSLERKIQNSVKDYHFQGEWYKLSEEQYQAIFENNGFFEYTDDEKENQLNFGYISIPLRNKSGGYHVFKKPKKTRAGKIYHRWYYYYEDVNGKRIQKACIGCTTRTEAETYIRTLKQVN